MSGGSAAPSARRKRAVESFKSAAETIGPIHAGMALFAVTRGQFSMIDAILHVLDAVGSGAVLSIWTWTIASYEIDVFRQLADDGRIAAGTLIIDEGARAKNSELIAAWKARFGARSVRYVLNHSKIATVEANGLRVLLRGSMNLNHNPRFEQLDVTEGGPDFDLIREIEADLEELPDTASAADAYRASKVSAAFDAKTLDMFAGLRRWAPK